MKGYVTILIYARPTTADRVAALPRRYDEWAHRTDPTEVTNRIALEAQDASVRDLQGVGTIIVRDKEHRRVYIAFGKIVPQVHWAVVSALPPAPQILSDLLDTDTENSCDA